MTETVEHLYQYRRLDSGQDSGVRYQRDCQIISGSVFWATSPTKFNDPFDCYPASDVSGTDDELRDYARRRSAGDAEKEDQLYQLAVKIRSGELPNFDKEDWRSDLNVFGVLCLSETPNSIHMWSHYADYHRGYCLEFDKESDPLRDAVKVIYDDNRPSFRFFDANKVASLTQSLFHKAKCWDQELEWRIFRAEGEGELPFAPDGLKAIILGAKVSEKDEYVLRRLNETREAPVQIKKARLCGSRFAIITDDD